LIQRDAFIMDFSTVDIRSIRYQTDLSGLTPLG